ncbi:MAG: hypothetical protein E7645_08825 [Ruminococcaceae bacterium]|nr:hypothetical protein [Oscillospiraceae bacterium]
MEEQLKESLTAEISAEDEAEASSEELWDAAWLQEAELLKQSYPDFELETQMKDPLFSGMLRGDIRPSLKQIYELCHGGEIAKQKVDEAVSAAVAEAVNKAVAEAVAQTTTETEERMLSRIRARGQRPAESGLNAALGFRTHPAVSRLTRADREGLARRASRGETIRL